MAGTKRPSFLKRQKEQKRLARAAEKREARLLKKSGAATRSSDTLEPEDAGLEIESVGEAGATAAEAEAADTEGRT